MRPPSTAVRVLLSLFVAGGIVALLLSWSGTGLSELWQRLRQLEIDFVQGFAIGRPKPLKEVLGEMEPAIILDDESTKKLVEGIS